jgi:two-component system NtrC family sensor kinase
VLAPAFGFHLAAAVACRGGEDMITVYAPQEIPAELASSTAASALDAFLRLTGQKHRSCHRPPFQTNTLAVEAPPGAFEGLGRSGGSVLDAPLVTGGEVMGLLRAASAEPDAFDAAKERTFYTVANQVSLALERVAAQREAEHAHLASLAESLSDGIVLVDAALRVTSLNSAAHDHLASLADIRLEEGATVDGMPLGALAQEALASGKPTALQDLPTSPASSERRYLVAMAAPLAGSPEGSAAVVILRDVTEERLMQERLLQSEKMVSVGQLVSGVAHELNNPLTGIMGFSQLLLARELDERTESDVKTIYGEAERAAKIVQNLLSFARRRRADKEPANLNTLVERVLELRSYDLRMKSIELVLELDPKLPETMVDPDQIQQVFFNVIVNAEQAMLAANGEAGGMLTVRSWREKDMLRLSLQDDGPGMEPETLRRIFDPFFTTKQAGEGTGLGLTLSYGIIDEHGGRIWAESRHGRGTTFIIELPIVLGGERPREPAEEEPAATTKGRSILVVDDEESIQRLLGSILELDGHQVHTARNGLEALERIGRRHYDVVITDIKMPDMDGPALYERLLKLDPTLAQRTVFITGDTVSPKTRDFLQQVRNPCLAKPFRLRQVRETILQILSDEP